MTIRQEIQQLTTSAVVDLYTVNLNPIGVDIVYRFYPGTTANYGPLVFGGLQYTPWAVKIEGVKKSGTGVRSRPTLTIANPEGIITSLVTAFEDMVGASVTKYRTLARYLDAVNGLPDASPDPTAYATDYYLIEQKLAEEPGSVKFELADPLDLLNRTIPGRRMLTSVCSFKYRNDAVRLFERMYPGDPGNAERVSSCTGCSWVVPETDTGKWFNAKGELVHTADLDACSHTLEGCEARFGHTEIPFGGWPGMARGGSR